MVRPLIAAVPSWALVASLVTPPPHVAAFAPSSPLARDDPARRRVGVVHGAGAAVDASPSVPAASVVTPSPTPTSFSSPPFRVYIEDTDAYGVVYNSNYVRAYERALAHAPRGGDDDDDDGRGDEGDGGGWILTSVAGQRFRSSPSLGEEYVVRGERLSRAVDARGGEEEVWRLEMMTSSVKGDGTMHNSATVAIARRSDSAGPGPRTAEDPPAARDGDDISLGRMFEYAYVPYQDEFDVHVRGGGAGRHIPLRSALNFFERSRTTYLGGPDALRRMQVDDDLVWVVTTVDDGELFLDTSVVEDLPEDDRGAEVEGPDRSSLHPLPGREIVVQTDFIPKRRGMIIECRHRLYVDADAGSNFRGRGVGGRRLLAKATVTVMALRGSTRRPTSKLPRWILDKIA